MKRILFILPLLTFACGCSTDHVTDPAEISYAESDNFASQVGAELKAANLEFALESFRELNSGETAGENIFYSPLSASIALSITYNGAVGGTAEAMADALGFDGMSLELLNTQYYNLIQSLQSGDLEVTMNIANSIWIKEGFPVLDDFIQRNEDFYLSQVTSLPFDLQALNIINGWVYNKTNGLIPSIITANDLYCVMFLINALYFKGEWTYGFDPDDTANGDFRIWEGTDKTVQMMKNSGLDYTYIIENDLQAVRLPYGRDAYSMYIFMPGYGDDLNDFIAGITPSQWNEWMDSFQSPYDLYGVPEFDGGNFRMPKFKASYEKKLNDMLIALGMGIAFDGGADFSGISDAEIFISFVRQKAVIEVNEEGSEAAAVTVVGMELGGLPPVFDFSIDQPFFFVIRDDRTETILFMGKIVDPEYD